MCLISGKVINIKDKVTIETVTTAIRRTLSTATVPPTRSFNILVIELPASQGSLRNLSSFEVAAALKIMN